MPIPQARTSKQTPKRLGFACIAAVALLFGSVPALSAQDTSPAVTEDQKLVAAEPERGDFFGEVLAIDGDTMIIGAPLDDGDSNFEGAAYVFTRTGHAWAQQQKLTAGDPLSGDEFGASVAIDGDTIVVGAPFDNVTEFDEGSAYVFTRSGSTWTQQEILSAVNNTEAIQFGESVAIEGDTIAVGANVGRLGENLNGLAFIFQRSGGAWAQQQELTASDGQRLDGFGSAVALSGNTLVVGAPWYPGAFQGEGSAYVFERIGGEWSESQKLGSGSGQVDVFGGSLDVEGDTIVVGAASSGVGGSGAVHLFGRSGGSWIEQQEISAPDSAEFGNFGRSVALRGDTMAVGAPAAENVDRDGGFAYLFERSANNWTEQEQFGASDAGESRRFGSSVGFDAASLAVGATLSTFDGGAVYVFGNGGPSTPPEVEAVIDCADLDFTVVLADGDSPTKGDDVILGTDGPDVIDGGDGNDIICGGSGADVINGGQGRDVVFGGAGNDELFGNKGKDTLVGDAGNDALSGGKGDDALSGGNGKDTLIGGDGDDDLRGDKGTDTIDGGDGDDELRGGDKDDVLNGDAGNDFVSGGKGADELSGGDGKDTLTGGGGDDVVLGNRGVDTLTGDAGNDFLSGGKGKDSLDGGSGIDQYNGGDGTDTCVPDPQGLAEQTANCEL